MGGANWVLRLRIFMRSSSSHIILNSILILVMIISKIDIARGKLFNGYFQPNFEAPSFFGQKESLLIFSSSFPLTRLSKAKCVKILKIAFGRIIHPLIFSDTAPAQILL